MGFVEFCRFLLLRSCPGGAANKPAYRNPVFGGFYRNFYRSTDAKKGILRHPRLYHILAIFSRKIYPQTAIKNPWFFAVFWCAVKNKKPCPKAGFFINFLSIYCLAIRYFCLTAKSIYGFAIRYDINPPTPAGISSAKHISTPPGEYRKSRRDLYRCRRCRLTQEQR